MKLVNVNIGVPEKNKLDFLNGRMWLIMRVSRYYLYFKII